MSEIFLCKRYSQLSGLHNADNKNNMVITLGTTPFTKTDMLTHGLHLSTAIFVTFDFTFDSKLACIPDSNQTMMLAHINDTKGY